MESYSPFSEPLENIAAKDLDALREVSEGWYVEYKEQSPTASALAKSISAFANTYGGWLFVGVREESKDNPVASSFPGVPKPDVDPLIQKIRKCATDHINPTPHFETRVVWCANGTDESRVQSAVICVWIPRSAITPHVHKSGQIYRRVADASEPKPESDRFVLDQLWQRADKVIDYHKLWHARDPEFSEEERDRPYIRLMITVDPWHVQRLRLNASLDQVREILAGDNEGASIPFDTVHTSADGYIGRQLDNNDPHNLTLTWRVSLNFRSDVIVPLPFFKRGSPIDSHEFFSGYCYADKFIEILNNRSASRTRIADLNFVYNVLVGVSGIQRRLCDLVGWKGAFYVKLKLLNGWRTVPFIDVCHVLERFERYGLPMCMDSSCSVPPGSGPEDYLEIPRFADIPSAHARDFLQGIVIFSQIAAAYGVPDWVDLEDKNKLYHEHLRDAGNRAIEVQRLRNRNMGQRGSDI